VKVVINSCYGGFGLSPRAIKRWLELQGKECHFFVGVKESVPIDLKTLENSQPIFFHVYTTPEPNDDTYISCRSIPRSDPLLIQVIEELGEKANSKFAELKIVEIPDDVKWTIEEYDGKEWIAEEHRTWS